MLPEDFEAFGCPTSWRFPPCPAFYVPITITTDRGTSIPNVTRSLRRPLTLHPSFLPQASAHVPPTPPPKRDGVIAPHARRLDVGGTLVVGPAQHADDAEQDGLGRLHGRPALGCRLVPVLVLLGRVEDRDAHLAVLVDCRAHARKGRVRVTGSGGDGMGDGKGRGADALLGWKIDGSKTIFGGRCG